MTIVSSTSMRFPPPRRSCLSVPATNPRALEKTHGLECDVVIFDLEDSVALEKKGEARDNLRRFFRETPIEGAERVIRINGADTEFRGKDLDLILELQPDALLLPKVGDAVEIREVTKFLSGNDASVRLWAMIETPTGMLNAAAIAGAARDADGKLDCLVLGLNDLRKETGVPPKPGRTYLVPWMMQVVLAARANGLDVIDSVFNDFRDEAGFSAECAQGRSMGFDGKMLIHPSQIASANESFGPLPQAIVEAETIIAAFADPAADGRNVINMDGRMVERLHLEQAEKLVAKAKQISLRKRKT